MGTHSATTYEIIHSRVAALEAAAAEKQMTPQHSALVELIESERHLLIGAKALATYVEPRFTKDTDYLVGRGTFKRARKWLTDNGIAFKDLGEAILADSLAIDIINADHHPVLQEILKAETGVPSPEALAALKYVSIVSLTRDARKRFLDISDFVGLVALPAFAVDKFLQFLVEPFEKQRPQAAEVIAKIKRGDRDIVI